MSVQIEKRFLTPKFKETPPPKPIPTLKTKNCFVCGTNKCYNGTLVEYEGEKHLVRVCNKETCKASIHTQEGLAAIKSKNLFTPSVHKPSILASSVKVNKNVEKEIR